MADLHLQGVHVLVIATEQIAERMAGPAIRSLNIARELQSSGANVTLATPRDVPAELTQEGGLLEGIDCRAYTFPSARSLGPLAQQAEVVVTQPLRIDVQWALARSGARIVVDLYVPSFVERIAQLAQDETVDHLLKERLLRRDQLEYAGAIKLGDAFICASERQKDFWLGSLGQAGRFDINLLERDARADQLISVAPFGIPDETAPSASCDDDAKRVMRGSLVPEDAIIALWTGGLWNWFDPVLVVEGLAQARKSVPNLCLVVMGIRHPEAAWKEQTAAQQMRKRASELGLVAAGAVVFQEGWVPYAERHRYLLEADFAVSAHKDTLETRFSFRTRFLDQLWCALPSITTEGGELTDMMVDAGAAISVAAGDVDAITEALVAVSSNDDLQVRLSAGARELAPKLRWSRTLAPLIDSVKRQADEHRQGIPPRRAKISLISRLHYLFLLIRVRIHAKGLRSVSAAARDLVRR